MIIFVTNPEDWELPLENGLMIRRYAPELKRVGLPTLGHVLAADKCTLDDTGHGGVVRLLALEEHFSRESASPHHTREGLSMTWYEAGLAPFPAFVEVDCCGALLALRTRYRWSDDEQYGKVLVEPSQHSCAAIQRDEPVTPKVWS